MIELLALLSLVSGWLLFILLKKLIDRIVDLLAQGYLVSWFTYGIIRSIVC